MCDTAQSACIKLLQLSVEDNDCYLFIITLLGNSRLPFIDDCGLMFEPQEGMTVEEIVGWASYAERSGYGYIFRSDHLIPLRG